MKIHLIITKFRSNIVETFKYGRQIGDRHTDGSVLRKGTTFFGKKNTKYLLDQNGSVVRFIERNRISENKFEILSGSPLPSSNNGAHHIRDTLYSNIPGQRYIDEAKFIGKCLKDERSNRHRWYPINSDTESSSVRLIG